VVFNEISFPYDERTNKFAISLGSSLVHDDDALSLTMVSSPQTFSSTPTIVVSPSLSPSILNDDDPPFSSPLPVSTTVNSHPMVTRAKVGTHKPKVYLTSISHVPSIPTFVKEVVASPIWYNDMHDEYNALLPNKTWMLTTFPPNASLVGCKLIFKTKLNANGYLHWCKAHLVAKGFNHTQS